MKKAALRRERLLDWGADEGIDDGRCRRRLSPYACIGPDGRLG
jgi:hypothetical protein